MRMSAAFVLNYLRCTFLFRGSFSSPNPGILSARLSTVSPIAETSIFLVFPPTPPPPPKKKVSVRQGSEEEERLSPARLGYTGRRAPPGRRGEGRASLGLGARRGRLGGEATDLPGNGSSDRHLLKKERGKRRDGSSACGSGESCGEPGAPRSSPTQAVSHQSFPSPSLT